MSQSQDQEPVIYDFNPNNLPPDLLRAVGLVVAASAQTESIVQELIGALLGIDNIQTRALTAHLSAPLRDHIVRSLAELTAPSVSELDAIDDLMDRANRAAEKRNVIVHNAFTRDPRSGEIMSWREKARGSLEISLSPVSVEEMERTADEIYEVGMDVMRFMVNRGLGPTERTKPLFERIDRRPKARAGRRSRPQ